MKRILIAGAGSYLGTAFERYIGQWPEAYSVETIRLRGDDWRKTDFSAFDVVYQVAGIAHQKETAENAQKAVATAGEDMTGCKVSAVNVHVGGVSIA